MADKRKTKKRKEEFGESAESEKPSSEEYAVAKWLKANVPTKKTKFLNHHVEYFTGAKAIDALLTSKWATGKSPTFTTRLEVSDFLHTMLLHKLFHRAKKVPVTEQELKGKKKKLEKNSKSGDEKDEASACEGKDAKDKDAKDKEKEKKKRKIRLEMHMEQVFLDTPDAYVWIYDPMPWYYWLCGALVVFGTIGVCMFPLWPATVRKGVYYLSVAAAAFLVLIIALTVLRVVIFCLVWMVTLSRHHLWLLPNLTEDVGFLASFWPLYKLVRVVIFCLVWMVTFSRYHLWLLPNLTEDVGFTTPFWPLYKYEYRGPAPDSDKSSKNKKKRKKDKLSDDEAEKPLIEETTTTTLEDDVTDTTDAVIEETSGDTKSGTDTPLEKPTASESDSENSQRSSTDRDFEMVDPGDLEPDKET